MSPVRRRRGRHQGGGAGFGVRLAHHQAFLLLRGAAGGRGPGGVPCVRRPRRPTGPYRTAPAARALCDRPAPRPLRCVHARAARPGPGRRGAGHGPHQGDLLAPTSMSTTSPAGSWPSPRPCAVPWRRCGGRLRATTMRRRSNPWLPVGTAPLRPFAPGWGLWDGPGAGRCPNAASGRRAHGAHRARGPLHHGGRHRRGPAPGGAHRQMEWVDPNHEAIAWADSATRRGAASRTC